MTRYLATLALTIVVEALVVAAVAPRGRRRELVRTSVFLNLFTHPLATLLFERMPDFPPAFVAIEAAVVAAEAAIYFAVERCGLGRAVVTSLAANVASLSLSPLFA